jgi:hypothetical protein
MCGSQVIIPAPYWTSYPPMAQLAGGKVVILETSSASGFLLTAPQLEAALTPASRVLILCSPSNPTGSVYPLENLQAPPPPPLSLHPNRLVHLKAGWPPSPPRECGRQLQLPSTPTSSSMSSASQNISDDTRQCANAWTFT